MILYALYCTEADTSDVMFALRFAVSVLVVSCPCAIGLACHTVIMVGTSMAAKYYSILFKSGSALEICYKSSVIVFDKTGTITLGIPHVMTWHVYGDSNEADLMMYSGSAESGSEHPIAKVITTYTSARTSLLPPTSLTAVGGLGICAVVRCRNVIVGSDGMMTTEHIPLISQHETAISKAHTLCCRWCANRCIRTV